LFAFFKVSVSIRCKSSNESLSDKGAALLSQLNDCVGDHWFAKLPENRTCQHFPSVDNLFGDNTASSTTLFDVRLFILPGKGKVSKVLLKINR
jgi:hypothetical protein